MPRLPAWLRLKDSGYITAPPRVQDSFTGEFPFLERCLSPKDIVTHLSDLVRTLLSSSRLKPGVSRRS